MQSTATPGFWREDDGSPIPAAEAYEAWGRAAYPVLVEVASGYNGWITYGELGKRVQKDTGIYTRQLLTFWIGIVLAHVVHEAHRRGDAPLTALAADANGRVGSGYKLVLEVAGQDAIEDDDALEDHAAETRLLCYRQFCPNMPADGGTPTLTAPLAAIRARRKADVSEPPTAPTCPTCFMVLPVSGLCDTCA
jgi:hypothetical protein